MPNLLNVPGVVPQELTSAPGPIQGISNSAGAILGATTRGPVAVATLVTSWEQYKTIYGGPFAGSYMSWAAKGFFDEGGQNLYVSRVASVGTPPTTALVVPDLVDRAGSPLPTLGVKAVSPGLWGDSLTIDIANGTLDSANTFLIRVYLNGVLTETWDNLVMVKTDQSRYAISVVNGGSNLIFLTDDNSATAAPANRPANQAGTALTTGTDGSAVIDSDFTAQLTAGSSPFDALGPGFNMAAPGYPGTSQAVNIAGATYAAAHGNGNCAWFSDFASGRTPAQVSGTDRPLLGFTSFASAYYPWILVQDVYGVGNNPVKYVPPSGHCMGVTARIDQARGANKAAAGIDATIRSAIGTQQALSDSDQANLNPIGVNCIRVFSNTGVVIWGNRSLSSDPLFTFFQTRRYLNFLKDTFRVNFRSSVFEPNDQTLWAQLLRRGNNFLTQEWKRRALFGATADKSYFLICDETVNTPVTINNGQVIYRIGVNITKPGEVIILQFSQFSGGATITENPS